MSLGPSGGAVSVGQYTQPNITPTADCIRFYDANCLIPLDLDDLNARAKEMLNLTDRAGIAWDCGSDENLANAVEKLIYDAFCDYYTNRTAGGRVPANGLGTGPLSFSVPAGGTWKLEWDYVGRGGNPTIDPSHPQTIFLDNSNNSVAGGDSTTVAGGTSVTVSQSVDVGGYIKWCAKRVDC